MNEQVNNTAPPQPLILIVEDSLVQAELLRRVLMQAGYRVAAANDGAQGMAAARKEPPDAIISDINMPVMDGYQLCRAIREDGMLKNTPVILLTMLSDARDVIHGLNAGANFYVTKPFNEQHLLSKVKAVLTGTSWIAEEKMEMEVTIDGEKELVRAGRQQIMNLLVSTYENAVLQYHELAAAQDELKKLSERLEEKAHELEDANKDLESFAYSVSHDLRVPLRAIDGFSGMVLDRYIDKLDDEGKRLLGMIRDNSQKMGQLINDILAFSRMGRMGMSTSEVDMEGLAREVFEELMPAAGRDLVVEVKSLPPARGDRAMLRQVWVNLLANAIKFTSHTPAASIRIGSSPGKGENIYFIMDNGAGFDMQYAEKLFGVFQRLHGADEFEGTGIGLAIVKRIVTRHGGRVWAEGKVNKGATFYFALPSTQGNSG